MKRTPAPALVLALGIVIGSALEVVLGKCAAIVVLVIVLVLVVGALKEEV